MPGLMSVAACRSPASTRRASARNGARSSLAVRRSAVDAGPAGVGDVAALNAEDVDAEVVVAAVDAAVWGPVGEQAATTELTAMMASRRMIMGSTLRVEYVLPVPAPLRR